MTFRETESPRIVGGRMIAGIRLGTWVSRAAYRFAGGRGFAGGVDLRDDGLAADTAFGLNTRNAREAEQ